MIEQVEMDVRLGTRVERCRIERDGPFWRVTALAHPDMSVSAATQIEAVRVLGNRLGKRGSGR